MIVGRLKIDSARHGTSATRALRSLVVAAKLRLRLNV